MDALQEDPEVISKDLLAHFSTLHSDPVSHTLDSELCLRTTRSLTQSTPKPLLLQLLSTGEDLLPVLSPATSNLTPLTRLLQHVITLLPLETLLPLLPVEKLVVGLNSDTPSIQTLCLAYVDKLSSTPSGAGFVASSADLSDTLVTGWLSTTNTEVAERSLESIIALLAVDQPPSPFSSSSLSPNEPFVTARSQQPSSVPNLSRRLPIHSAANVPSTPSTSTHPGNPQNPLFWRRLLLSPSTYSLLFSLSTPSPTLSSYSSKTPTLSPKAFHHATTTAQARLMDFLVRLARLNFTSITSSLQSEIEDRFTPSNSSIPRRPYAGLLRYLHHTLSVPPSNTDPLMSALQRDFYISLVQLFDADDASADALRSRLSVDLIRALREDAGLGGSAGATNGDGVGMSL